jgi:hypothetical protein
MHRNSKLPTPPAALLSRRNRTGREAREQKLGLWAAPIIAAIPPARDESIEAAKLASERALKLKKVDTRRPGASIPHCTH